MTAPRTEALHPNAKGLDTQSLRDIAALLSKSQTEAAATTMNCLNAIASGASAIAITLKYGETLHYIAAGSSGLMAAADAMELGGTFSIPAHQIKIHMAGGLPTGVVMPGDTEDDIAGLAQSLANLTSKDTVIAISASGTTPYTVAAAKIAKDAGATLISIANNAGTPLLDLADHAIHLDTPAEVLSGSTRMGAGTAQKIALNMLSTLMAVELGHVFDGMMVNLHADNIKLRGRAIGIVSTIADINPTGAEHALDLADGRVKQAILIAKAGLSPDQATDILLQAEGHLRAALARLT